MHGMAYHCFVPVSKSRVLTDCSRAALVPVSLSRFHYSKPKDGPHDAIWFPPFACNNYQYEFRLFLIDFE